MYVRVRAADIAATVFTHLYSEPTGEADSARPCGITEWTGLHGNEVVSMAWDWVILDDGLFSRPAVSMICTNMMLVDAAGYDAGPQATQQALAARIATLRWQSVLSLLGLK